MLLLQLLSPLAAAPFPLAASLSPLAAAITAPINVPRRCDRASTPAAWVGRRELLRLPLGVLPLAALHAAPAAAAEPTGVRISDSVKVKIIKAKSLRAMVRRSAQNRRSLPMDTTPGVNNYPSLTQELKRQEKLVLLPLQAELARIAASAELPEEKRKALALQPLLLKGHLLELQQALAEAKFEEYTSKTTKATYPGGKVERELEEVCETLDDFLALAAGKDVEIRDD
ncbi:hypothetical protein AB1Y20_001595 [Prymnesium parvum]|uniref:Uncharacterized protein n=1 Tax=Prymnesium parvum TaxID=97485 RepID=A0AB34KCH0_PRYPA